MKDKLRFAVMYHVCENTKEAKGINYLINEDEIVPVLIIVPPFAMNTELIERVCAMMNKELGQHETH